MPTSDTRYELPPERISLTGHLARRAHKTALLQDAAGRVVADDSVGALLAFGRYVAAATVSYGRAYYQPTFDAAGAVHTEPDPATGMPVRVEVVSRKPSLRTELVVEGSGWRLRIEETIQGTSFGFGSIGMPSSTKAMFTMGAYEANATGIMTLELVPLPLMTRVRGRGELSLRDSAGNLGRLTVSRRGALIAEIGEARWEESLR